MTKDGRRESRLSAKMLPAIMNSVREQGLESFSLASLAEQLNTSSRMLIYHFGSRDELLGRVLHAMRIDTLDRLENPPPKNLDSAIELWWHHYTSHLTDMQLFFHLTLRRFDEPGRFEEFASTAVDAWAEYFTRAIRSEGGSAARASLLGRLCIAALRGLVVDLLVTDDWESVEAALQVFRKIVVSSVGEPVQSTPDGMTTPLNL